MAVKKNMASALLLNDFKLDFTDLLPWHLCGVSLAKPLD
jgi:hypothetical protein